MKSRLLAGLSVAALVIAGSAIAKEAVKEEKIDLAKIKCMISGKPVKAEAAADYQGGKVHFCCNNCVGKFKKDSKPFAVQANHHLAVTKQFVQKGCPMSGKECNAETGVDVSGVKVTFCCENCQGKAASMKGKEQIELVFNDKSFKKSFELAKKKDEKKEEVK